jgi:hypothetical protein
MIINREKNGYISPFKSTVETREVNPLFIHLIRADEALYLAQKPLLGYNEELINHHQRSRSHPTDSSDQNQNLQPSAPTRFTPQITRFQSLTITERRVHQHNIHITLPQARGSSNVPGLVDAIAHSTRDAATAIERLRPGMNRDSDIFLTVEGPLQNRSNRTRNQEESRSAKQETISISRDEEEYQVHRLQPAELKRLVRQICIGNEMVIYTEEDVSWPSVSLSFKGDKAHLNRVLDEWYNSSRVMIKGHPIAIRDWSEYLGRGLNSKSWSGAMKRQWNDLKV